MSQPIRFPATIEQVTRHTPDVVSYRLRSEKRLPRFTPGQFIHLTVDDFDPAGFWPESRVFSVANAVADRHTVELTISRQGAYTGKILDQLQQGDRIWAKGPYGDFTIDASHGYRRAVLIAGGTGITPFCAFMDAAQTQGALPVEEAVLHYGARAPDLLIYRPLAEQCAARFSSFRLFCYAEQTSTAEQANLRIGRLNPADIVDQLRDTRDTLFYLSGPKAMIDTFTRDLTGQQGIAPEQIRIDAWE